MERRSRDLGTRRYRKYCCATRARQDLSVTHVPHACTACARRAVGVLLYYMLTKKYPFWDEEADVLDKGGVPLHSVSHAAVHLAPLTADPRSTALGPPRVLPVRRLGVDLKNISLLAPTYCSCLTGLQVMTAVCGNPVRLVGGFCALPVTQASTQSSTSVDPPLLFGLHPGDDGSVWQPGAPGGGAVGQRWRRLQGFHLVLLGPQRPHAPDCARGACVPDQAHAQHLRRGSGVLCSVSRQSVKQPAAHWH